jgi:branched-chain amino acid transport system ATP-binding protein
VVATNGVGRTFQTPVAGRGLTALEAVQNGLFPNVHSGYVSALVRSGGVLRDEKATAELARHTLDLVRFTSDHYKPVAELTLGELRRVELARVLVGDPRVIVLDEPTSGLELMDADALFGLLRELAHVDNRSVLVVEHNVRLVFEYSDYVTVMNLGHVIADGTSDEISADISVREAYLGAR